MRAAIAMTISAIAFVTACGGDDGGRSEPVIDPCAYPRQKVEFLVLAAERKRGTSADWQRMYNAFVERMWPIVVNNPECFTAAEVANAQRQLDDLEAE